MAASFLAATKKSMFGINCEKLDQFKHSSPRSTSCPRLFRQLCDPLLTVTGDGIVVSRNYIYEVQYSQNTMGQLLRNRSHGCELFWSHSQKHRQTFDRLSLLKNIGSHVHCRSVPFFNWEEATRTLYTMIV